MFQQKKKEKLFIKYSNAQYKSLINSFNFTNVTLFGIGRDIGYLEYSAICHSELELSIFQRIVRSKISIEF